MGAGKRILIHGQENAIIPIRRYNFWGARRTPDAASFVVVPIARRPPLPTVLLRMYLVPFKRYSTLSGDTARRMMVSALASMCVRFIWPAKSGELRSAIKIRTYSALALKGFRTYPSSSIFARGSSRMSGSQ